MLDFSKGYDFLYWKRFINHITENKTIKGDPGK